MVGQPLSVFACWALHARSPSTSLRAGSRPARENAGLRDDTGVRISTGQRYRAHPFAENAKWWGSHSVFLRVGRYTRDPLRLRSGQALAPLERTRGLRDDKGVRISTGQRYRAHPFAENAKWWGSHSVFLRVGRYTRDPLRLRSGQALAPLERTRGLRDDTG